MKKIPTSFQLGSYTINVIRLSSKEITEKCGDVYGMFSPGELTIYLAKPDRSTRASIIYQTFFHELSHALLWVADPKRYTNEKLVEHLGQLLAQVNQTAT